MTNTRPARQAPHAVVRAFMTRQGVDEQQLRSDGRLTLTVENRYRLHLQSAPLNRVAISAQVLDLSGRLEDAATTRLLEALMNRATGMLQQYPSTLSIDARTEALLLQHTLAGDVDASAFEEELGSFVSALKFWHRLGSTEALRA